MDEKAQLREITSNRQSIFAAPSDIQAGDDSAIRICANLASCTFQTVLGYVCLDIMLAITLHYIQIAYPTQETAANGVGLAYTIVNVGIIPMGLGFNQSLNVHVAQALGSGKVRLSRNYLNLTIYSHLMYYVPMCIIIYFLKIPFSYLIVEKADETTDFAWDYIVLLMVSTIFAIEFECFKTYLIACKVFAPFIFIHISTTALLLLWCYLFIEQWGWGIWGGGLAITITEMMNCLFLYIFIMLHKSTKAHFEGFTIKPLILAKWPLFTAYLKTSFSIIIHVYADFFVFFLLTFLALGISSTSLNAQIAFSNTSALYFRMPISLSLALMTFIGQEMGALNIKAAKRYAIAGMGLFILFATAVIATIWLIRDWWAEFYAGKEKTNVQDAMLDTLPYFLLGCIILDGSQGSLTGVLKGINRAPFVTYSTLIAYYVCGMKFVQLGIPLICWMTFGWGLDWGITGIWLGFGIANGILLAMYVTLIFTSDWEKQAQSIKTKVNRQNKLQMSSLVQDAQQL